MEASLETPPCLRTIDPGDVGVVSPAVAADGVSTFGVVLCACCCFSDAPTVAALGNEGHPVAVEVPPGLCPQADPEPSALD